MAGPKPRAPTPPGRASKPGGSIAPSFRPPATLFVATSAALLLTVLMFWGGAAVGPATSNIVGFAVGSVLGFVLLGWFSVIDNRRRIPGLYQDWPIKSRLLVRTVSLAAWALGIVHAYLWALELTRHM